MTAITTTDLVLAERRGAVLVLTLNRPERLNAWTDELEERYYELLDAAEDDPEVRAIVVTGAGRGFCAGADLGDLERGATTEAAEAELRDRPRPRSYPLTVRKPMIAAINGAAAGLGLVEALYCDVRFATSEAKLTTAFARRGLVAEYGVSWLLPRLVGPSAALDLLLSGRVVRGEEALRLRLVDRLSEPERVVDDAVAYAAELAAHSSPWSMATIKAQVQADLERSFGDAAAAADELMLASFRRTDVQEGVRSYLDQRAPAFPSLDPPDPMNFDLTDRAKDYLERVTAFMDECVYPAEHVYEAQMRESGDPHFQPPSIEELKGEARARGLWNLFHPHPEWGPGLTNAEYAPLAELMGRSPHLAPEAMNCSAPDTGNMEVLTLFGTEEHRQRWLRPLLDGEIRSAFAMTEPAVASSDATNIETRIERVGDEYVINGRKWWTSNALHRNCRVLIVMGKTDPEAEPHRQQSMLVVPLDTPGVTVVRGLPVFGYQDREGHAEVLLEDVRVPDSALLAGEGDGFMISQARLGPGRIHHCMRSIGMAERALELLCQRALARTTFGKPVAENANIQDWIAEARIELEMVRLLCMKTAWLMDTVGNRHARVEIAAIKVAAPQVALKVIDRAIQVHGGGGVSDDFPLAYFYASQRTLRLADGPDEVHKRTIAQRELRRWTRQPALAPVGS